MTGNAKKAATPQPAVKPAAGATEKQQLSFGQLSAVPSRRKSLLNLSKPFQVFQ